MVRASINMPQFVRQIYKKEDASGVKTVFLDRDGILNYEVNYLSHLEQFSVLPGVSDGIKKLNNNRIVLIVITNQPVVARGLATIKGVKSINDTMVTFLNKKGASINAVYFCPHHPERNHPDISPQAMKYRIECQCRKPKLAMFKAAIKDFNVNLEAAFIVGDRTIEIEAGEKLGITTILVKTGVGGKDNTYPVTPDYIATDFSHVVDIIISQ